jgi:hypothetical protein
MKVAIFFLHIFFLLFSSLEARYHAISNERKYNTSINKYPYTIVCFVDSALPFMDRSEKKDYLSDVASFKKALKSASTSGFYNNFLRREVGFLIVDLAKETIKKKQKELNFSEMPTCLLLKDGEPIDEYGNPIKITGFSTKKEILDFLDEHIGSDLDLIVEGKKEEEKLDQLERTARYEFYNRYPVWGWGPYYHYPFYGYSPYSHFHVGFGIYR